MRILHICPDRRLRVVRGDYLSVLGFEVTAVDSVEDGMTRLGAGQEFDLVLLCHTVPAPDKSHLDDWLCDQGREVRLIELFSVHRPVTSGIPVDACSNFQPYMSYWAQAASVHGPLRGLLQDVI